MLRFRISCSNRKFAYNFNSNGSIHDLSMTDQVYKMQKNKKRNRKDPKINFEANSPSAAGRTRRRLGNTSLFPAADHDFIRRNARVDICLFWQDNV